MREVHEELAVDLARCDLAALPDVEVVDEDLHLSIWRIDSWPGDPLNVAPDEHDLISWFGLRDALALPLAHPDYPSVLTRFAAHPTAS